MFIDTNPQELVCAFILELPDICSDIVTSQFYIMLNVARNVLLAPPPQSQRKAAAADPSKESAGNNGAAVAVSAPDEAKQDIGSKLTELSRDADVLAKFDMKPVKILNIKKSDTRDEVKVLLEHFLEQVSK